MMRRTLILAAPQAALAQRLVDDQWDELARAWNPFAEKLNKGIVDVKLWRKVISVVNRIEGK